MQQRARAIALGCTLALAAPAVAVERGWTVDVRAGHIEGPGMTNKELDLLRRVDGIEEGRRLGLGMQWQSGGPWYVRGNYTRSVLRYESPLNPACPVTANQFLPPFRNCQTITDPRVGQIQDRHHQLDLAVGYRWNLLGWLGAHGELGYGLTQWRSREDIEANATAGCLAFSVGIPPRRLSNCVEVNRHARADGLVAALGIDLWPASRFSLTARINHQSFRYRIYRNDLYARFATANNLNQAPGFTFSNLVAREPPGSWTWGALQARYALSPWLSVLLQVEGLGNRDWETVDLGLRFRL
mgnify:FL=1